MRKNYTIFHIPAAIFMAAILVFTGISGAAEVEVKDGQITTLPAGDVS